MKYNTKSPNSRRNELRAQQRLWHAEDRRIALLREFCNTLEYGPGVRHKWVSGARILIYVSGFYEAHGQALEGWNWIVCDRCGYALQVHAGDVSTYVERNDKAVEVVA